MKRILPLFLAIFICVPLFVVSFADSYSVNKPLSGIDNWNSHFDVDLDIKLFYAPSWVSGFYTDSGNLWNLVVNPHSSEVNSVFTVRFYNKGSSSVKIVFDDIYKYKLSSYSIIIFPGSYVDVTSTWVSDISIDSIFVINSVSTVNDSYSVFNAGWLIGNVGSMFGFISNSSFLLPLLLIGVTISFGLVAVRYIRKVMWGN